MERGFGHGWSNCETAPRNNGGAMNWLWKTLGL